MTNFALPPEITELIPGYILRRCDDFEHLQAALAADKWELLQRIAHQTRSHAPGFGFQDLEALAKRLEDAARRQDRERTLGLLKLWGEWIEQHS